jgi:hypothetical protein
MRLLCLPFVLALVPAVALGTPGDEVKIDYPAILVQARERYGLEGAVLADTSVTALLDSDAFLAVRLGPFDVRLPVHEVTEKAGADLVSEAAGLTLEVCAAWARWTVADQDVLAQALADVTVLKKWVKGWSSRTFKRASETDGADLFERMADDEVREAGRRLGEALSLGLNPDETEPAQLVFVPSRTSFAELTTLAGAIEPERQKVLWGKDSIFVSAGWSANVHFVALEYATWSWDPEDPTKGESMNTYVKTGRAQHIVERAGASLTRGAFNSIASPLLEGALHTNLVIEIVGADHPTFNTWSFQWSRAGGSTQPYSRFVPGGNSAGGTLPPRQASAGPVSSSSSGSDESPWRENDGRDYFREALKKGQKKGAKLAGKSRDLSSEWKRDKLAHFAIGIAGKSETTLMSAPFLGDAAEGKATPPKEFLDDYEEFFRSYRACFSHWLRSQGHPDGAAASEEAFGRLIARARGRTASDTLSSMVAEVYGVPISAKDGETDSLEWRFLAYLAK